MIARRQISLPEELCAAAERQFGRFSNVESLLEFVLQELTRRNAEFLDEAEQVILEERLRDLGYM